MQSAARGLRPCKRATRLLPRAAAAPGRARLSWSGLGVQLRSRASRCRFRCRVERAGHCTDEVLDGQPFVAHARDPPAEAEHLDDVRDFQDVTHIVADEHYCDASVADAPD